VLPVCDFLTDQARFMGKSAAGLLENSRPGAVLGGGMDGISPAVEKLGLPVYIEGRQRHLVETGGKNAQKRHAGGGVPISCRINGLSSSS